MSNIPISKELFPLVDNINKLEVLYAKENFDNKTTVDFWNKTIKGYCIHKRSLVFTIPELISFFTIRNGAVPTSIKKSIEVLESSEKVVKKDNFNNDKDAKTNKSIFSVIMQFSSMFISNKKSDDNDDDEDDDGMSDTNIYICKSLLRNVEEKIFKYLDIYCIDDHDYCFYIEGLDFESSSETTENTLYLKNFMKKLAVFVKNTSTITSSSSSTPNVSPNPNITSTIMYDINSVMLLESIANKDSDIKILCQYMKLHGTAILTDDNLIIKFIKQSTTTTTNINSIISDSDKARLELKTSIQKIRKKISIMDNEIKECKQKAIKLKQNNDTNSALYECKIMRLKTDHNKKLYSSLCTLEMAISNIEKIDLNASMLEAYVIATKGLKAAKENVSIDTLEDAIDAFNDEMNDAQQYDDLIANAVGSNQYDEELEKELENLMTESSTTTTTPSNNITSNPIVDLPSVPNTPIELNTHEKLQKIAM